MFEEQIPEIFKNSEDYFNYFEQEQKILESEHCFPKVILEIKSICERLKDKINKINGYSFFTDISEILGYDARLQILIQLCEAGEEANLTEDEIITISRTDYPSFVKELCGYHTNETPLHSLCFSVI